MKIWDNNLLEKVEDLSNLENKIKKNCVNYFYFIHWKNFCCYNLKIFA